MKQTTSPLSLPPPSDHPTVGENHPPIFENHPPINENHPPIFENYPPIFENHLPIFENHPPIFENHLPINENHLPIAYGPSVDDYFGGGGDQPVVDDYLSFAIDDCCGGGGDLPVVDDYLSFAIDDCCGGGGDQPVVDDYLSFAIDDGCGGGGNQPVVDDYLPVNGGYSDGGVPSSSSGGDSCWWLYIPIGMKFQPTDQELIIHYLMPESIGCSSNSRGIISYADIYNYEPAQLTVFANDYGDGKMYFFTKIKKIGKSKTNRCVKSKQGKKVWRANQAATPIKGDDGRTVGKKIPLTYFEINENKEGKEVACRTKWLMYEYLLERDFPVPRPTHQPQELVIAVVYYNGRRRGGDER